MVHNFKYRGPYKHSGWNLLNTSILTHIHAYVKARLKIKVVARLRMVTLLTFNKLYMRIVPNLRLHHVLFIEMLLYHCQSEEK